MEVVEESEVVEGGILAFLVLNSLSSLFCIWCHVGFKQVSQISGNQLESDVAKVEAHYPEMYIDQSWWSLPIDSGRPWRVLAFGGKAPDVGNTDMERKLCRFCNNCKIIAPVSPCIDKQDFCLIAKTLSLPMLGKNIFLAVQ